MKPSLLRRTLVLFLAFGLAMGIVFPLYAQFFVEWRPGLKGYFVAGCLVAGLLIGLANYAILHLVLIRALVRLSAVTSAIGEGDLTRTCSLQSRDALGRIADGTNAMARNLREVIAQVSELGDAVFQATGRMRGDLGRMAGQIQESTRNAGAVAAALTELSGGVGALADHVQEAARSSGEATRLSQEGGTAVQATAASMGGIERASRDAQREMEELEQVALGIDNVLTVIAGIAGQTQMLSLNASIEAAHAGDMGKGFAVVADEVRKLAEQAQTSSEEIRQMVERLQALAGRVADLVRQEAGQAKEGAALADRSGEALQTVVARVQQTEDMVRRIAEVSAGQARHLSTLESSMTGIQTVMEQSAGASASVEEHSAQLLEQVGGLRGLLGRFRLA